MKAQRVKLGELLRSSLWAVPGACTLLAALLAFGLIAFDRATEARSIHVPGTFAGGAASAQAVLSVIAGSMITLAGTVYSLTIVVLTLASSQFAPRVLGSFMRDRSNQIVLGFFVATFTYSLLVLRAVRSTAQDEFVPGSAVTAAVLLALISLGMLIYFIDHIFHGIQVSSILAGVARETVQQIDHLYPQPWEPSAEPGPPAAPLPAEWTPVFAAESGYLQFVDYDALLALATEAGIVLREDRHLGAFVTAGTPLLYAAPPVRLTPALRAQIGAGFALGRTPTLQQDIGFGLRQIVDIALKAISPAVNDPTTCVNCIDHLGVILVTLATRRIPRGDWHDTTGQVRILLHERSFHDQVRLAFDQIRHYGAGDPIIVMRLLDTLAQIAAASRNPASRASCAEQMDHIVAAAEGAIRDPHELGVVRAHAESARQALAGGAGRGARPPSASA